MCGWWYGYSNNYRACVVEANMSSIRLETDQHNIVHLILDNPNASANLMDDTFQTDLAGAVEKIKQQEFAGIILRSAKPTFFAGGDLTMLSQVTESNAEIAFKLVESIKASLRYFETCGKPVVACINGDALGGGWELALACHYRVAVDSKKLKLGLPEVTLGLLPGAGGVTRMVRHLGVEKALPFLTQGKLFSAATGKSLGLVDAIAENSQQLLILAKEYILSSPETIKPWDQKGFKLPGGTPSQPKVAQLLSVLPSMVLKQTHGVMPAPEAIVSAVSEGAQVDFDTATRIESRYFVNVASSQVAKNMINTFWFQLNEIKAGANRPESGEITKVKTVGVIGAGMMGAGIAYSCAIQGIHVVLKDTGLPQAEKGKDYSRKLLKKLEAKGKRSSQESEQVLALITCTDDYADMTDCDIVIEAVFEDRKLKATVTQACELQLKPSALFVSNTSTLPITGLAEASKNQANFAGLHFFSPVDKMPLVEIIRGMNTSDESIARCVDFVQQINKTPIVVNDSRGFYTSRIFQTYVTEGLAMLREGVPAASIENAAFWAGFPVGPLAVTDEVSLTLIDKIKRQTKQDYALENKHYPIHPSDSVVDEMLSLGRAGKAAGAGFYDYSQPAKKRLWDGLQQHFPSEPDKVVMDDVKERLLFIMAVEAIRCMQENVINTARDANVGSIFGVGFPAWTGGTVQFVNQYGLKRFVERCTQFSQQYGERFSVPNLLHEKISKGELL